MNGYILRRTDNTPLYYCYEIIYDNPKLSIEDIKKYYKKSNMFTYENIDNIDNIYNQLQDTCDVSDGDIILLEDNTYYFYSRNMIKIIHT
jgi:hypothetical protein